jgi:hypothetical protein
VGLDVHVNQFVPMQHLQLPSQCTCSYIELLSIPKDQLCAGLHRELDAVAVQDQIKGLQVRQSRADSEPAGNFEAGVFSEDPSKLVDRFAFAQLEALHNHSEVAGRHVDEGVLMDGFAELVVRTALALGVEDPNKELEAAVEHLEGDDAVVVAVVVDRGF